MSLAGSYAMSRLQVKQVLVVSVDGHRVASLLHKVFVLLYGQLKSQQFTVSYTIILLCKSKSFGEETAKQDLPFTTYLKAPARKK